LNSDGSFNRTIVGDNGVSNSYLWDTYLFNLSVGLYKVRVDAIDIYNNSLLADSVVFNVSSNSYLSVNAFASNGTSLSSFGVFVNPGNMINTTITGSLLFDIIRGVNYNVTFFGGGFANNTFVGSFDNLSNNVTFNLTYLINSLYIRFYDQDNLSLLVGPSIWLDLISDDYSNNYSTDIGVLNVSDLVPGSYVIRYGSVDYMTRYGSALVSNGSTQNVSLYMLLADAAGNVTVTVIDQNANPVSGAVVKALKYDLGSNSYLLEESAVSNVNGEVRLSLTLFDEFYKFMVETDGVLRITTVPAVITSNSLTIQILTSDLVGSDYNFFAGIYSDISFNVLTDNFRLDYDDVSGLVYQVCLEVSTIGLVGESLFNSSCSSSSAAALLVGVLPVNGTTYIGRAYYYLDGVRGYLDSESYTYPGDESFGKVYGLLLQLLITVSCCFLVIWSIPLAALVVPLTLVLGRLLHLNFFGWDSITALVIVGIIIAYLTRKNNG
jgi:hypothetical protein